MSEAPREPAAGEQPLHGEQPAAGEQPVAQEPPIVVARPKRGGAPRPRSRAASTADEAARLTERPKRARGTDAGSPSTANRATGLRLARVHLRMGSLLLARAELESFTGRGALDDDGLLDLAEVRWRTGDLPAAGEAANALLSQGRDDALALVIAAEAVAAMGRPREARQLAGRALVAAGGPLEPLFAGMPRSLIWPADPAGVDDRAMDGAIESTATPANRPRAGAHRPRAGTPAAIAAEDAAPASAAAAEAFAGGRAALGGWDPAPAALRLGVALRLEPGFAEAVLEAIGERATEPALALVAGDALRLLGRESEALAAFDRARGHTDEGGLAVDPDATRDGRSAGTHRP